MQAVDGSSWQASSPSFRMCFSISFCVAATISSIRAGMDAPSAMSLFRARRATSRRTVSKPLTITTPGVSSMIRSTPVPSRRRGCSAFAADDPALHLVVGNADGAGGGLGGMGGGVALQRSEDDFPGFLLAAFGQLLVMAAGSPRRSLAGVGVEHFQQPLGGLRLARPLTSCSVCRCISSSFDNSSLRGWPPGSARSTCAACPRRSFPACELARPVLPACPAACQEPFALVQLTADLAKFLFAFVLLLEPRLLDFQLALAAAVFHLLPGLADDFRRLMLGILPPQAVENLDQPPWPFRKLPRR